MFVLEATRDGWLIPTHVPSEENVADFLTKPLSPAKFKKDIERIGLQRAPRRSVKKKKKGER